jgi:hypothetical protein
MMYNMLRNKWKVKIYVKGQIDQCWSDWLGGLQISHTSDGRTVLRGYLRDQSSLYGVLSQLAKLGLVLVSVSSKLDNAGGDKKR